MNNDLTFFFQSFRCCRCAAFGWKKNIKKKNDGERQEDKHKVLFGLIQRIALFSVNIAVYSPECAANRTCTNTDKRLACQGAVKPVFAA